VLINNVVEKQYTTSNNLEARIQLHKLYSENKVGWSRWVFDQISFQKNYNVLELGCGVGNLWLENTGRIPYMNILITDLSDAMINIAENKLRNIESNAKFEIVNAEEIPYKNNSFDIIIANHMLYHINDIDKAIFEVHRVLKPGGRLYATTLGKENMCELESILYNFDTNIVFPSSNIVGKFSLESGKRILNNYFEKVECKRYEDSLNIQESEPLLNYVLSLDGIGNVLDIIKNYRIYDFKKYLDRLIDRESSIRIKKDSGMLITSK